MYTASGLISHARAALNGDTKYIYSCAMQPLTLDKLNEVYNNYPQYLSASRYEKAKKEYIGKNCTDCSGLIYSYYRRFRTSESMYNNASKRQSLNRSNVVGVVPPGAVLWRDGHVGIYVGDGYEIEARGFDYGIQRRKVSETTFTHWLTFDDINYNVREGSGFNWWILAIAAAAIVLTLKK